MRKKVRRKERERGRDKDRRKERKTETDRKRLDLHKEKTNRDKGRIVGERNVKRERETDRGGNRQ